MVLLVWIPLKQKPGMGTILNAIILAIVIDVSLPYLPNPDNYTFKIIQVVIGVVIVGIGSGFYLVANLGAGPRDGLMIGLQKKTNLPIVSIRTILETSAVAVGWLMGGVAGLGTAIFAFWHWSSGGAWSLSGRKKSQNPWQKNSLFCFNKPHIAQKRKFFSNHCHLIKA